MNTTKAFRFTIPCIDGKRRFIFCRSLNTCPMGSTDTGTSVISTDNVERAFVTYGEEFAAKNLAYFTEHSHGLKVEIVP